MNAAETDNTYAAILRKYLFGNQEEALLEAYEFAKSVAMAGLPPEELVALHEHAVGDLPTVVPSTQVASLLVGSFGLLVEAMIAYGLQLKFWQRQMEERQMELDKWNQQLRRMNDRLLALYAVSSAVSRSLDLRDALEAALNALHVITPEHALAVYLREGARLTLAGCRNFPEDFAAQIRQRGIEDGLAVTAALSGEAIVIQEDLANDARVGEFSRAYNQREGYGAAAIFPFKAKGEVVGVLTMAAKGPYHFSDDELDLLRGLADQIAVGIQNARLHARLVVQSHQFEEASRHKSEFLASMSHELRTPLNAIIGFSEILGDQTFGTLNERQLRYIGHVHNSGQHLLALINDILDLSKIEAGKMELFLELFSVQEGLEESMAVVKGLAAAKRIALSLSVPPDLGLIQADRRRFKQVLFNILSNAIKFTPEEGQVSVTAEAAEGFVRIAVADTGIGIALEDRERIFEAFEQAERFLTREYEGTGLGLTLVKQTMELHGGQVYLESTPGKGSTFTLAFPLPSVPGPPPEWLEIVETVEQEIGAQELDRPRILIIEDDSRAAELMATQLSEAGMAPMIALSGEEGLQRARSETPDAIILDLLMPVMDGWKVLEQLREDPRTREIPVVVVTIVDEPVNVETLGVAGYFVKPWNRPALLTLLGRLVGEADPKAPPLRILVIDDDPAILELVGELLRAAGYEVVAAASGTAGLEAARSEPPHAIILDIMLPDISGLDVLTILREDPRTGDVPVVIYSSHELTDQEKDYIGNKARAMIPKGPDGMRRIAQEVRRLLGMT